jgi:hypothetical protein
MNDREKQELDQLFEEEYQRMVRRNDWNEPINGEDKTAQTKLVITDAFRNSVLEEVAIEFDKLKNFGDTSQSFAKFVRDMKK